MKRDVRRKVLWAFGILALLCPCAICGTGYFVIRSWFTGPAESLPAELQRAKKDGIPLEPADLRTQPPIPDERNAATIYAAFLPHLQKMEAKHRGILSSVRAFLTDKASVAQAADARRALAESKESLDEIAAATKRPFCDFHYRWEDGFRIRFPEFAELKSAAYYLAARARDLGSQGKIAEAFDVLATVDALARHAGMSPVLIAKLVELSIHGIVMAEFCHLIELSAESPALLAKAQHTLDGFGPLTDLRPAFFGEVVLGRITLHQIHTFGDLKGLSDQASGENPESKTGGGPNLPDWFLKGTEAKFVARWRQTLEAMPKDPADWEKILQVLDKADRELEADNSPVNQLNQVLFPVMAQSPMAVGHQEAYRHIAATSIRLLQDWTRTGQFPATLPAYGLDAIDPFDGKPLRYRKEATGFTIYSIDRDRKDNGGNPQKNGAMGDLVRTFELRKGH